MTTHHPSPSIHLELTFLCQIIDKILLLPGSHLQLMKMKPFFSPPLTFFEIVSFYLIFLILLSYFFMHIHILYLYVYTHNCVHVPISILNKYKQPSMYIYKHIYKQIHIYANLCIFMNKCMFMCIFHM